MGKWDRKRWVWSVEGEDELAADVSAVADLLCGGGVLGEDGQSVGGAFPTTLGKGDAVLVGTEVGEGDDAIGAAAQGDGVLEGTLSGHIKHRVDPVGSESADPLDKPIAVHGRGRAERRDVVLVVGAGGADDARSAGNGELDR